MIMCGVVRHKELQFYMHSSACRLKSQRRMSPSEKQKDLKYQTNTKQKDTPNLGPFTQILQAKIKCTLAIQWLVIQKWLIEIIKWIHNKLLSWTLLTNIHFIAFQRLLRGITLQEEGQLNFSNRLNVCFSNRTVLATGVLHDCTKLCWILNVWQTRIWLTIFHKEELLNNS